jgi:hypothetical protein
MVNLEYAERELTFTTVADTLLPAEEDVLVLSIVPGRLYVRAPGNILSGRAAAIMKQTTHPGSGRSKVAFGLLSLDLPPVVNIAPSVTLGFYEKENSVRHIPPMSPIRPTFCPDRY